MRALALILGVIGAASSSAAPPPPANYPADFPSEVGGYRMEPIYQIYHSWLSRQRKEALLAALPPADNWQGRRLWNRVVESEIDSYDFGIVRADRLDRFCEGNWIKTELPGRCAFRYSFAIVPGSAWNDPALNKAIADSFRPADLARRLAALKFAQNNDDWSDPTLREAFQAHVDPQKLYAPLVRVSNVSEETCPALTKAIAALGKVTVDLAPDAITRPVDVMAPHGARTEVRLTVADQQGRAVILKGATPLHEHLAPLWAVVEECASKK